MLKFQNDSPLFLLCVLNLIFFPSQMNDKSIPVINRWEFLTGEDVTKYSCQGRKHILTVCTESEQGCWPLIKGLLHFQCWIISWSSGIQLVIYPSSCFFVITTTYYFVLFCLYAMSCSYFDIFQLRRLRVKQCFHIVIITLFYWVFNIL